MQEICLQCLCNSCIRTDIEVGDKCETPNCINCDGTHICKDCKQFKNGSQLPLTEVRGIPGGDLKATIQDIHDLAIRGEI